MKDKTKKVCIEQWESTKTESKMEKRLYVVSFTYEIELVTFGKEVTVACGGEWRFIANTPDEASATRSKLITHGLQLKDAKRVRFSEAKIVDSDRF